MDPRSHGIGTNTLKFCVCVCVCGGGGGGGEDGEREGEGDGGRGKYRIFPIRSCVAEWIGYGFPRSPGYTIEGLRQSAIFQVARNLRNFGMLTLFLCQQMSLGFFFHKRGNEASNTLLKVQPPFCPLPPPPPPPPMA